MSNFTQNNETNIDNPPYDPSLHGFKKGWIDGAENGGYPKNYFYADSIRSIIIGFGNYFNNVFCIRYNKEGEPIKKIQVPVKFGPRMKSHDFRTEQESGKKYYIQLPNITYKIDSMAYASERNTGTGETRSFYSKYFEVKGIDYLMAEKFWQDIHPVPFNINISMEANTEYISDANQIMEQVMVRFAPEAFIDLKEFWFINKRRSIKMICESCNMEMNQDFGEEDKRETKLTFQFKVEAWLYKPIRQSTIIDQIITSLGVNKQSNFWTETIKGNYDGSLSSRYDLSYEFGTKIGKVSALLPFEQQPIPVFSQSGVSQEWEYEELTDITNYPKGSIQLVAMSSINDPEKEMWNKTTSALPALSGSVYVDWIDKTGGVSSNNDWSLKYWQLTANKDDLANPCESGSYVYQVFYNPNWVVSAGVMSKSFPQKVIIPGVFGGTIIKEYKNLFGYGDFGENLKFGTKDAILGEDVVKDAPWVSQITTKNTDII